MKIINADAEFDVRYNVIYLLRDDHMPKSYWLIDEFNGMSTHLGHVMPTKVLKKIILNLQFNWQTGMYSSLNSLINR